MRRPSSSDISPARVSGFVGEKVCPGSPGQAASHASRYATLLSSRDWRPVQNRMLAESGQSSKSPSKITCKSRAAIRSSMDRGTGNCLQFTLAAVSDLVRRLVMNEQAHPLRRRKLDLRGNRG